MDDHKDSQNRDEIGKVDELLSQDEELDDFELNFNIFEWESIINEWFEELDDEDTYQETNNETNMNNSFRDPMNFKCELANLFQNDLKSLFVKDTL